MNHARTKIIILILIIISGGFLRFYNLMFDSPYFFNPDERNMAGAITRFTLPSQISAIPSCLISEFFYNRQPTTDNQQLTTCSLNPHFFAYGQFPLYLAYISDQVTKPITNMIIRPPTTANQPALHAGRQLITDFPSAVFWLRFYSALASTMTVLLVFLITRRILNVYRPELLTLNSKFSILAALCAAFTPGLIQAAHFGTTESLLTFFFMASIYCSLKFMTQLSTKPVRKFLIHHSNFIILNSIVIGLALGSKLTGFFFFVPAGLSLIIRIARFNNQRMKLKKKFIGLAGYIMIGLFLIIGSLVFWFLSSPYNLVEKNSFKGSVFGYEADVALGRYEAFYTRQFVSTHPILFQAEKIFPYALGWPTFILGTAGFLFLILKLTFMIISYTGQRIKNCAFRIKRRKSKSKNLNANLPNYYFIILTSSFLLYFIPNAFLFAKWTRFMTPILPIFSIFSGYVLYRFYHLFSYSSVKMENGKWKMENYQKKNNYLFLHFCIFAFSILALLPGLMFMSIYARPDSRMQATYWIFKNIPDNSYLLFETANVVDIPLGIPDDKWKGLSLLPKNYTLDSFDFYHMDENPQLYLSLLEHLEKADYFFIPSRRIFKNYLKLPKKYPHLVKFYQLLFSGRLGFEKVIEFKSFPGFSLFAFRFSLPDEDAEESFTVFDHPVVRIYKKNRHYTKNEYSALFEG